MNEPFSVGIYEARYYPADGKSAAGWRVFLGGEFIFSNRSRGVVENWMRSRCTLTIGTP